jgi:transcription initiation factor IIE alpha subunit
LRNQFDAGVALQNLIYYKKKGRKHMYRTVLRYQNRIDLLSGRAGRENGKIIAKLKRQLRKLQEQESK